MLNLESDTLDLSNDHNTKSSERRARGLCGDTSSLDTVTDEEISHKKLTRTPSKYELILSEQASNKEPNTGIALETYILNSNNRSKSALSRYQIHLNQLKNPSTGSTCSDKSVVETNIELPSVRASKEIFERTPTSKQQATPSSAGVQRNVDSPLKSNTQPNISNHPTPIPSLHTPSEKSAPQPPMSLSNLSLDTSSTMFSNPASSLLMTAALNALTLAQSQAQTQSNGGGQEVSSPLSSAITAAAAQILAAAITASSAPTSPSPSCGNSYSRYNAAGMHMPPMSPSQSCYREAPYHHQQYGYRQQQASDHRYQQQLQFQYGQQQQHRHWQQDQYPYQQDQFPYTHHHYPQQQYPDHQQQHPQQKQYNDTDQQQQPQPPQQPQQQHYEYAKQQYQQYQLFLQQQQEQHQGSPLIFPQAVSPTTQEQEEIGSTASPLLSTQYRPDNSIEEPIPQPMHNSNAMERCLASASSGSVELVEQQSALHRSLSLESVPSFSCPDTSNASAAATDCNSTAMDSPTYRDYFTRYTGALEAVRSLRNNTNTNVNNQPNTCFNKTDIAASTISATNANTNLATFCSSMPTKESELSEWEKHMKLEVERRNMMEMLLKDTDAKDNRSRLEATHHYVSGHYSKLFHNCDPRVFEAEFLPDSCNSNNSKHNNSNGNIGVQPTLAKSTSDVPSTHTPSTPTSKKNMRKHSFYRSKMTQLIVSSPSYIKPDTLFRNFSIASGMLGRDEDGECDADSPESSENQHNLLEEYIQYNTSSACAGGSEERGEEGGDSDSDGYGDVTESAEDFNSSSVMMSMQAEEEGVSAEEPPLPPPTGARKISSRCGRRQHSTHLVEEGSSGNSSNSNLSALNSPLRATRSKQLHRTASGSTNTADTNNQSMTAAAVSTYGTAFANPDYATDSPKLVSRKAMSKKTSSFGQVRSTSGSTRNVHTTFQFDPQNKRDIIGRQTTSVRGQSKLHDAALDFIQDQCLNSIDALNLKKTSVQNRDILIGWQILLLRKGELSLLGLAVITGVRTNMLFQTEYRVSTDVSLDCWVRLKRRRGEGGMEFQPLRKVLATAQTTTKLRVLRRVASEREILNIGATTS